MAVQGDYTAWLADGEGQIWEYKESSALPCRALPLKFAPPVLLTSIPLESKGWEAIYAVTGDGLLIGIDPKTFGHSTIGDFDLGTVPPLLGLSANADGSFRGLATLVPPTKAEILSFSSIGRLQSKTDFDLGNGETARSFATSGANVYVFSQQTLYNFQPSTGRVVETFPIPEHIPEIVAVASSRCAYPVQDYFGPTY